MIVLIGLSSFPFFSDIITNKEGVTPFWVPDLGIEKSLTDANGKILTYSKYRVFIYFFLFHCYSLVAWLGWFSVAKNKPYRLAILLGAVSSSYQIFLILSNSRKSSLNNFDIKIIGTAVLFIILFALYYYFEKIKKVRLDAVVKRFGHIKGNIISLKVLLIWLLFFLISTGPYFHDIVTKAGIGVKEWIPILGIEEFLTYSNGKVWGFGSYRIFILTVSLQVFAQIGWAGWLHDAKYKLYRPFLLVPVGLSLYQIVVVLFDQTVSYVNRPDVKLLVILAISSVVCYFYFFKNKSFNSNSENPNKMPQSVHNALKNN